MQSQVAFPTENRILSLEFFQYITFWLLFPQFFDINRKIKKISQDFIYQNLHALKYNI